jgi:hypothetical protein
MYEDAARGILPPDPTEQFDAYPTHAPYREGLAKVMAMIRQPISPLLRPIVGLANHIRQGLLLSESATVRSMRYMRASG